MPYNYLLALHIVFIVTWFSGLFFLGRIFVYHLEALSKTGEVKEELTTLFTAAEKRVMGIIIMPSMTITLIIGTMLMMQSAAYTQGWFHLKMLLVVLFVAYNIACVKIRKKLTNETIKLTSLKLRLFNEIPFLFLITIVFMVFSKQLFSGIWAGLIVAALVSAGVLYRKKK